MTPDSFHQTNTDLAVNRRNQLAIRTENDAIHDSRERTQRAQMLWSNAQIADIAAARDPETTKPAFANVEARGAELLIRQTGSEEYRQLDNELAATEEHIRTNQRQIDELKIDEHFLSNDLEYAIKSDAEEINRLMVEVQAGLQGLVAREVGASLKHAFKALFTSQTE